MEPAIEARGGSRRQVVRVTRFTEHTLAVEARLGDYREVFFVITGDRTVTISSYDESDPSYPEAQVFVFAKPYGWTLDLNDDDVMVEIWQAVGVQR